MRVSGLQIAIDDNDVCRNCNKILEAVRNAAADRSDILLTPEGSLSGYHNRFSDSEVRLALKEITRLAQSLRVGLALGTCFLEDDGKYYNQIRFYNKDGDYLGFHSKILLCSDSLDEPYSGEITRFVTKPLEVFRFEGVVIAGLICNDLWGNPGCTPVDDPHLTHKLARMGVRVVFHAVNGGRGEQESIDLNRAYHESNQRLRAIADRLHIVTVDNAYPTEKENSSAGGVIGPDGRYRCRLPLKGEGFFTHDLYDL